MKTVGTLLKETRVVKGYTLDDVEAATKIRAKFLAAIEADDFRRLPTPAVVRGFVNNYAEFLGLNSQTVLAFLRRQIRDVPRTSLLPKQPSIPFTRPLLQLTPTKFLLLLVGGLVVIFLFYLGLQYRQLKQPPALSLEQPADQLVSREKRIEVIGRTDSDATVMVNNISILVRSDGRFYDTVNLEPGVNKISIIATSRFGKITTETREVGYQP